MKAFVKNVIASIIGTCLALMFLFFLTLSVIAGMATFNQTSVEADLVGVQDNSVLRIDLNGELQDHVTKKDLITSFIFNNEPAVLGLYELSQVLEQAAQDKRIRGILLDFQYLQTGLANAESLRRELVKFKKSNKFIIAYGETLTEVDYMIATAADEVILYPKGFFEWNGIASKLMFFKNTMTKLDVVPQVFKVGKYKSAVEPWINEKMSDASREQSEALFSGIWSQMIQYAAEKTQSDKMDLDKLAEEMSVMFAQDALEKGFVNSLASREEVDEKIKELSESKEKVHYVSWSEYLGDVKEKIDKTSDNTVALVFAAGQIFSDSYDDDAISSKDFRKLLDKIRRDKNVKAVVIRVNSPGGSALASDVIWTGTQWLKDAKPVVTSFGNVAASGGYYMSAGSQYIFAEPTTITGSIGVFGLTFASKNFWNKKVGSTFDTVKTHQYADLNYLVREYRPDESAKIQSTVEQIYDDFLKVVSLGREKLQTPEHVHEIAQGRVWLGSDALNQGLVDEMGGMNEAVVKAAELAKIKDYKVEVYPKELSAIQQFFKEFGQISHQSLKVLLPEVLQSYLPLEKKASLLEESIYTRLPFDIEIQ